MPLKIRGSVSARFSVRFSVVSAARKSARLEPSGSSPPRSNAASDFCPRTRCRLARFLVLASVSSSVPFGKSKAARPTLPGIFSPGGRQRSRPAIIRCRTRNSSSSSSKTIRLPKREKPPHDFSASRGERWIHGAQQERRREPHPFERLTGDTRGQRLDVNDDVGELRHARHQCSPRWAPNAVTGTEARNTLRQLGRLNHSES